MGFKVHDSKSFSLLLNIAALLLKGLFNIELKVEITDVHALHSFVESVEDVELHIVEGLEERADELGFEGEQLGQFVLQQIVVIIKLLG